MTTKCLEEIEKMNMHIGDSLYISDLLKIDWNFPMRHELLKSYLK